MSTQLLDPSCQPLELIDLRQQAHYWQALHRRAVEREQAWKAKAEGLEAQLRQQSAQWAQERVTLEGHLRQQATQLATQAEQMEALKARVVWLQQQVFGRKTEGTSPPQAEAAAGPGAVLAGVETPAAEGRRRGKQPGAKGYGRKPRSALPTEVIRQELPEAQQQCPRCGKPFDRFPGTEDSEEIHWEVRLIRRVYQRGRYRPTCRCGAVPAIVTAPVPAKVIPKGLFSTGFWVQVLLEKYLFQRPLYRVRQRLALEGVVVSQGTLTGGLQRLGVLLQPLYTRLLEHSRQAHHWHMDETGWSVFAEVDGKQGYQWWLWVVLTADTCVYLLDPSRSAAVPKQHLGEAAEGIVNADRLAAYKALGAKIRIAFCWSHIRRDFVRIRDGYTRLQGWAEGWIERINALFGQNEQRRAVPSQSAAFVQQDQLVRQAVAAMAQVRDQELADPALQEPQRKALESLRTHWEGATLFVEHPEIPMDNNEAERCLRNPVVGRKNYYGSGSVWSGLLSAILFSLFQTYLRHHLDPQQVLLAYLDTCAQQGGQPPEKLESWLPWTLSETQKQAWRYPQQPP